MPRDADQYDLFVSYARRDNTDGWITRFLDELRVEHRKFQPNRELTCFFDQREIGSLDDWRHRIYGALASSRLFLAFLSPNYFASEWCRREWRNWIDLEIAKHILSSGAAPIYIVEVPGLTGPGDEQEVARQVADLCQPPGGRDAFLADTAPVIKQLRRRQFNQVQPFYRAGLEALLRDDLRRVLEDLAHDLDKRAELVRQGADSPTTVPPYNKRFSGRLDELLELREQLQDDRAGVISGVHGLGGVGKTELAFTYAHAFAAAYPGGRFLVPCERKSDLGQACLQLDEIFRDKISDEDRKTPALHFAAIRGCLAKRLEERGHILLVLDNVTDAGLLHADHTDALTTLGPKLHLLATTRLSPAAAGWIRWTTLGELPETDALELLEKHRPFADDTERDAGRKIVRRLGGFALAVELVASWLAAHPEVSCSGFLERLGLEELESLEAVAQDRDVVLRRHNHERRLEAVLGPTLAALTKDNPPARRASEYAAFLPADQVPWPWLKSLVASDFPAIAQSPKPGYPDPWDGVHRALEKYALVSRAKGTGGERETPDSRIIRVHRLVQDLLRRELSSDEKTARQQAVDRLAKKRDAELENVTRWAEARWELYALEALALYWSDTGHPEAARFLNQAGVRWYHLAEWTRAEPLMQRALAIDEAFFGPEHPNVAARLSNLAQLLKATNRLAEAEPLMQRALAIDKAFFGPGHPRVAICLNNLAQLLEKTNRLTEAEPLMQRALAIDEAFFGRQHPTVANRLNNLAQLLKKTNRLAEAEPLMRRALEIDEASLGPDHPNTAHSLSNLAGLLNDTNRMVEAEPLMQRALAIDEMSFGPAHPRVATRLNNLAQLLKATNRLAEAEELMRRALTIDEESFGPDHPNVARDLNNLAQFLYATKRPTEAESLMRPALDILLGFANVTGHQHPNHQLYVDNYAGFLKLAGMGDAEIHKRLNGIAHPHGFHFGG